MLFRSKQWDAILFETKGSETPTPDRYKAIRNAVEVTPGGLTKHYETRKALITAIETGKAQFVQTREESSPKPMASTRATDQNPAISRYEKPATGSKHLAPSDRQISWHPSGKLIIVICAAIALMLLFTALLN